MQPLDDAAIDALTIDDLAWLTDNGWALPDTASARWLHEARPSLRTDSRKREVVAKLRVCGVHVPAHPDDLRFDPLV